MRKESGGEGWIRTSVRLRGQIYSLPSPVEIIELSGAMYDLCTVALLSAFDLSGRSVKRPASGGFNLR